VDPWSDLPPCGAGRTRRHSMITRRLLLSTALTTAAGISLCAHVVAAQQGNKPASQPIAISSSASIASPTPLSAATPASIPAPTAHSSPTRASASAPAAASTSASSVREEESLRIEGEKRFATNCGRCHQAPHKLSPRMMATVVRHMRVRATISDEDMRLILRYMTQ
jgi:cytochrome c5